jgi:hypothetical protein
MFLSSRVHDAKCGMGAVKAGSGRASNGVLKRYYSHKKANFRGFGVRCSQCDIGVWTVYGRRIGVVNLMQSSCLGHLSRYHCTCHYTQIPGGNA